MIGQPCEGGCGFRLDDTMNELDCLLPPQGEETGHGHTPRRCRRIRMVRRILEAEFPSPWRVRLLTLSPFNGLYVKVSRRLEHTVVECNECLSDLATMGYSEQHAEDFVRHTAEHMHRVIAAELVAS